MKNHLNTNEYFCRTTPNGRAAGVLRSHLQMKQPWLHSISNLKTPFIISITIIIIINLLIYIFTHNNISLKCIIKSNII